MIFGFLVTIFDTILYRPLFNSLILIYDYFPAHDFGLAIIFLTIIIRLILYPLSVKALKSQRTLQKLQPKLQEIQKKYKDDKEKQASETLEIYRKEKINPFSGLFLALVQLPILIALYRVFFLGLRPQELNNLYHFVVSPGHINSVFLTITDLSKPNVIFAFLAGLLQFFQTKMLIPKPKEGEKKPKDASSMVQKQMVYFLPVITVVILYKLPSALALYWIVSGIFSIIQQYIMVKNHKLISD